MEQNTITKGEVMRGKEAQWYNFQQSLNGGKLVYREAVKLIELRSHHKLLDVGCGTGLVLFKLFQKYGKSAQLYGVDPSEDMIQMAQNENKKTNSDIHLKVGAGEKLDFKDSEFDWVISSLTFHHLPNDAKKQVLGEIRRVLKPSGNLLISDFGMPKNLFGRMADMTLGNHAFIKDNLAGSVVQILKEKNFQKIRIAKTQFGIIEHVMAIK